MFTPVRRNFETAFPLDTNPTAPKRRDDGEEHSLDSQETLVIPITALPITNSDALSLATSSSPGIEETPSSQDVLENLIPTLVAIIESTISDNPEADANDIASILSMSDESLLQLMKRHRLSEFKEKLSPYLESNLLREEIESVFFKCYLDCLLNGVMRGNLAQLEKEIKKMLEEISPQAIKKIISNSRELLNIRSPKKEDRAYWQQTMTKLTKIRNYTFYLEPKEREAFSLLIEHSQDHRSNPSYPNCSRFFATFCARMDTLIKTELNPTEWMDSLHTKYRTWESRVKPAATPEAPLSQQAIFQNRHIHSFWIAGANLIKKALKKELSQQSKISSRLSKAIDQALRTHKMEGDFKLLLELMRVGNGLSSTDAMIHDVWSFYLSPRKEDFDLPSLISLILSKIPPQEYQKLIADLNLIDLNIKTLADNGHLTGQIKISKYHDKADKIEAFCNLAFTEPPTLLMLKKICS